MSKKRPEKKQPEFSIQRPHLEQRAIRHLIALLEGHLNSCELRMRNVKVGMRSTVF